MDVFWAGGCVFGSCVFCRPRFDSGFIQILGSIARDSLFNLTVKGYKGDNLIFTNTTTVRFIPINATTFVQIDRSSYQPGDTVKIRIVSVQMDNLPYKGRVDISAQDPTGKVVNSWESTGDLGIVLQDFILPQTVLLGEWLILVTVNIYGSTQFFFSKDLFQAIYTSGISSDGQSYITAIITDISTGLKVNKTVEVHLMKDTFVLAFHDFPPTLKPSLHFFSKLRISRYDRKPLSSEDLKQSAVIEVTQRTWRTSTMNTDSTTLTFPVPEDGNVHIKFQLQDQAKFQSSEETLTVYNYTSPTGAYIQISPINTLPAQVSLNWSSDRAQPGEQVSLTLTTLEPRSRVAIMVLGTHGDVVQTDPDSKVEQDCDIGMLTNARLFIKNQKQPDGPKYEHQHATMLMKYLMLMEATEYLLWLDTNVRNHTWTSEKITVPDGVISLRAVALVMSDNLGLGFTPMPPKLSVSKDFSLSLDVPSHLIRGEEIVLEVKIINHLESDIEVILLLAQSEAFEFVLADRGDVSVVNAQKFTLGSHVSASALFPIRPVALGMMEISVDAVSAEASDSLVWRVLVKPQGVEQFHSETLFLELAPVKYNHSRSISFSFPPDVVPGSQRAHVALVGDILALSMNKLDSLVQMPLGCGEQNMIHFAPSVYVLQYLDKSNQDNKEIRSRALGYMMEGYQKQLSYQRDDGSFSAFGASTPGSIWLTAFVLRCFLQAQPYMQIDQSVLTRATTWLLKHQGPQGEFSEVGRLIHTEMQGGLDNGPEALTAYVLMALMEDQSYVERYADNISRAQRYLEDKVSSGVASNYSLCLVAYALALASSPVAGTALTELSRRAHYRDGVMMWSSSAGQDLHEGKPRSAQIEMASYVLLANFRRGSLLESIELMKWLCKQRTHLGGFGTTQDTVIALQALAYFSSFSGAIAIDLKLNISSTSSLVSEFHINSNNYRTYHSKEINVEDINLTIQMEGRGFAVFQMNVFYNLESKVFSQKARHAMVEEAFLLDVKVTEDVDHNHMRLSICTRLKDSQAIPQTGMAILEVGMLSGFSLSPGATTPADIIRKVEVEPEKVTLYLDSLTKSEVCFTLPLLRDYKVAHVQDAVVQVYDYYEPTARIDENINQKALSERTWVIHSSQGSRFCSICSNLNISARFSGGTPRQDVNKLTEAFGQARQRNFMEDLCRLSAEKPGDVTGKGGEDRDLVTGSRVVKDDVSKETQGSVCTSSIQAATVWHRFTAKLPHVVNQNFPRLKDLKLCTNYKTFQSSPCVKE
ncbi:CD109 antigen 150 kDa TGF-beta-1-binding protein C3 and PZP-like alpha-2-macroglobulin domain-containing protein 7 [Collichthys lucidus]|uniref:CD109 antigen 150 kDa TGF-beta-1-binding protein C3 and PZP-like alpha-2-macroglobulin domain-containing protein 7 n=1 Tax=Collichthys lucidus TaxID=240159 RepID=A0A4U5VEF1_COLLU|nr:CD109 antigen 150 kDa TGF-beta-1-binding protein C3 and PZP-like alpha-2-macroglobulin domain-containing protein 7 [Collichthys lucidus]